MLSSRCTLKEVDCIQVVGSKGITCMVCLWIKQKCGVALGEEKAGKSAAGSSVGGSGRLPHFSEGTMKLLVQLVVGVERVGLELMQMNERLEGIEKVVGEYMDDEVNDITNKGMNQRWWRVWQEEDITRGVRELSEENQVFREFLWEWGEREVAEDREESGSENENEQRGKSKEEKEDKREVLARAVGNVGEGSGVGEGVAAGSVMDVAAGVDGKSA